MATRKVSDRQKRTREESELFWATRMAKAQTPRDRASVELNRLMVALSRMPHREAQKAWGEFAGQVATFRQKITDGDIHTRDSRRDSRR